MTQNIKPEDAAKLIAHVKSMKEVSGVLHEIGATQPGRLVTLAPQFSRRLDQLQPRIASPVVQRVVQTTSTALKQLNAWQLKRNLDRAVQPTIPISVSWDNVPAATLGAQATVQSPYSGQPFRVCEVECLTDVSFRFPEFNIGGIDFAEPSRTRVQYGAGLGAPAAANRGIDFPTIKARDKTRVIDANWQPWVNVDFTSDATISITPFNYGTVTGSVILTLHLRANPCGNKFTKGMFVSNAARMTARNAIMGASFIDSLEDGLV